MSFKSVEAYSYPYSILECLKMALNWLKSNAIATIYIIHKKANRQKYLLAFTHFIATFTPYSV